jgi:hypothetical protein
MNDVLPKPFTKDSLLGMLEKHLLHMKQMQELGQSVPPSLKTQRLIELDPEQDHQLNATPLNTPLPLENPGVQFPFERDYSTIFSNQNPPNFGPAPIFQSEKRRAVSARDPFEYHGQERDAPHSVGIDDQRVKRVRYNTPPW